MVFVTLSNENSSKLLVNRDFKENDHYPHKYNCLMPLHLPHNAVGLSRLEFMEFQAPYIGQKIDISVKIPFFEIFFSFLSKPTLIFGVGFNIFVQNNFFIEFIR